METETQKNWNDFFFGKNHNKQRNNMPLGLIIILTLIIGSIFIYSYFHKEYSPEDETAEPTIELTHVTVISNKNGKIMGECIDRVKLIFENIYSADKEDIASFIKEISRMDLSDEYDEFKEAMIKKLKYYMYYMDNGNKEYYEKYKEINNIEVLSKAFDAAGVSYRIYDDEIHYTYYKE